MERHTNADSNTNTNIEQAKNQPQARVLVPHRLQVKQQQPLFHSCIILIDTISDL